jgi:hypothetical protein
MFTCRSVSSLFQPSPKLTFTQSRPETILAFLELIQSKYGGVEQYLKQHAGFTDGDIAKFRENILIPAPTS